MDNAFYEGKGEMVGERHFLTASQLYRAKLNERGV